MKPKIGITLQCNSSSEPKFSIYKEYIEAILEQGALPVGLPHSDPLNAKSYVSGVEGILCPGGIDVNPLVYGEEADRHVTMMCREMDYFEIELVKEAIHQKKPVFGICRGIQLINAALGGTLIQDLGSQRNSSLCHYQDHRAERELVHRVFAEKNSWTHKIFGLENFEVNSYHHQAVKDLAPGLKASAKASDGLVEAIESEDGLVYAVQWHPERVYKAYPIFAKFFKALIDKTQN